MSNFKGVLESPVHARRAQSPCRTLLSALFRPPRPLFLPLFCILVTFPPSLRRKQMTKVKGRKFQRKGWNGKRFWATDIVHLRTAGPEPAPSSGGSSSTLSIALLSRRGAIGERSLGWPRSPLACPFPCSRCEGNDICTVVTFLAFPRTMLELSSFQ